MAPDQRGACKHMPKALPGMPFFRARVAIARPNFAGIFSISRHSDIVLSATAPAPSSNHVPFLSCPVS